MHEGHRARVKKRFLEEGLDHFSDIQALELLLFYALPRVDTNPIAHGLLDRFGSLSQVLEGIQELSQIRKEHIKMVIDGEEVEDDFLFGAICNSTSVGGILTLDPEVVDLRDNKLEILLVRAPRNLAEIHECILALNSQKYDCAMLTFRSATHIRIFADPEMPWTLDGEREEGHSEVVVTPKHLAYQLVKRE